MDPEALEAAVRDMTTATTDAIAKLNADYRDLKELTTKIETKMGRPNFNDLNNPPAKTIEQKSFEAYARLGLERMPQDERKSLITGNDPQAGYLAPVEFVRELDKNLVEFSPVRAAARVGRTSSGQVNLPKRTAGPTGFWVGETQARSETTPAYGLEQISINEIAAFIDVSNWMLEDSAFDMQAELTMDFAEAFGTIEGAAFISGDGVNKPEGIMSAEGMTEVVSGAATTITADSLRTILYSLPAYYRRRSSWIMNSTTFATIAKLKDGEGNYLHTPGLREGEADRLLGRPVVEAPDMPDVGAGLYPIVIGDFSRYRIFDRIAMSVLRDPFTQATSGMTRFHARKRVGGQPTMIEAFRKLKCST